MRNTKSQSKKKRNDIILIAILLAFASAAWILMGLLKDTGGTVTVTVNGSVIGTYQLDENQLIPIKSQEGFNRLVIQDGKAYVDKADCRDGLCMKQGKISKGGENIVCLPHKTVITVDSKDEKQVDGGAQ